MPIYQYVCPDCKTEFEQKEDFNNSSTANCPRCSRKARRIFSAVPIVFKGSGFYCTDHPKSGS